MDTQTSSIALKGGEWIIKETQASEVFIPEDFSEEARMMQLTCEQFLEKEVFPFLNEIDSQKNPNLMPSILKKAGELGMLSTSVPAEYGGLAADFTTTMLVTEVIGAGHSFAVAMSAHTGIGTLPITYYGNESQKSKYLPDLNSGNRLAAYCLTEPDSGSDANSGKTHAVLNAEGTHYLITGQKMWITNGGFADIFIVFAKIDQDKNLTAFIVERGFGGITMNEEEHKLGIKGSSTRQIFFNDCPVPIENMLSSRENGFKIAVNILNIGRIKLAGAGIGATKMVTTQAVQYANVRKQFGLTIGSFGAIQHKLAEMATRVWAMEAAVYRASQNIDDKINALIEEGLSEADAKLKATEQYAIECAILKVHGSEVLDFVTDEGLQIYGGMGYSADAPMERSYRDSRINRIFEGTNEINRLLAVGTLLKRAMKGELNIIPAAMSVGKELMAIPENPDLQGFLASEKYLLDNLKKAFLLVAGAAAQKYMTKLDEQQELMMLLADMLIEIYVLESTMLRVEKLASRNLDSQSMYNDFLTVYLYNAVQIISNAGQEAIFNLVEGDEQRMMLMGLKRFTKLAPIGTIAARKRIAMALLKNNGWIN